MADIILGDLAKILLSHLSSAVIGEVKLVLGLDDELGKIKSNLSSIQAVLNDAERQQSTSESVKNWLGKLQDVMYDIDDLLDGITADIKIKQKHQGGLSWQVRKFFSRDNTSLLQWEWAHQIKSLSTVLDRIAFERNSFVFFTEPPDGSFESSSRETHSKVNKSQVLGRDSDKKAVIASILSFGERKGISVLPIVGFGGVGKSTFAQLLYNDPTIDENFDLKLWVYVSDKFNMKKILKQVISMTTGESQLQLSMEQHSLEELRIKTSNALKLKKYFLVLDDMWNQDSNEWKRLSELLDVGANGSTVIVTTRDSKVAFTTQTFDDHHKLMELTHGTCLEIFKRLAFKESGTKINSKLLSLADKIVGMSRGLPLLVTTLGNLLRGQTNEKEWYHVIQHLEKGHQEILNILKVSYDQIPSIFKLCFCTSSIYGRGSEINSSWELLPMWMALGFIPSDEKGEALGMQCIEELLSKSILNQVDKETYSFTGMKFFRMHDFVHDLANSMAGEGLKIVHCKTKEVSAKVKHIILEEDGLLGGLGYEGLLMQAKKARLLRINAPGHSLSKAFLKTIFSELTFLRVLHLNGCQFEELPRTIGYMKHLRCLELEENTKLKHLPNSICNLINLQSLNLHGCTKLQELPADIGRLENLRVLFVTTKQEELPESIGNIKGLRTLNLFRCPKLACLPVSMTLLVNLDILHMQFCRKLNLAHGSCSLEGLKRLRVLIIIGLPNCDKFLNSVTGRPFTFLQHLVLGACDGLLEIGDWIKCFISLKTLYIGFCSNLKGLPNAISFLDKIEMLAIIGCPILSERCTPETGNDWHLISNIPCIKIDEVWVAQKNGIKSS